METKKEILAILKEVKPTKNLEKVTDIIEGGYIDSFEFLSLVTRLSEVFGVEITIEEFVPENFNSLDAIAKMIETLKTDNQ